MRGPPTRRSLQNQYSRLARLRSRIIFCKILPNLRTPRQSLGRGENEGLICKSTIACGLRYSLAEYSRTVECHGSVIRLASCYASAREEEKHLRLFGTILQQRLLGRNDQSPRLNLAALFAILFSVDAGIRFARPHWRRPPRVPWFSRREQCLRMQQRAQSQR
jgi:hypothetical protein